MITSAWHRLSDEERSRQPLAGGVFVCSPGVRGRPEHRFGGDRRRAPVYMWGVATYDAGEYHSYAVDRGVNVVVYAAVRAILQPFFHAYFRMRRLGREHIPRSGPVILAANHRSFLDPFVIGCLTRRPVYYVAKKELFAHPVAGWLLNRLGAFPIDRGAGDQQAMDTARLILERGDCVVIFPEGTPHATGTARQSPARRRPPRAADGRARRAGCGAGDRGGAARLARAPAPRHAALRRPAAVPARRGSDPGPGRRGDRPHLAVRRAPMGLAGRADAPAPAAPALTRARRRGSACSRAGAGGAVDPSARAARRRAMPLSRRGRDSDAGLRERADEDLMALVRQGDARAFEVIYDRHCDVAFSLAYRMCGARAAAEEVVQEAFLSLWRSGARYDRTRGSVRTWVLGDRPQPRDRRAAAQRRLRPPPHARRHGRRAPRGAGAHGRRGRPPRRGARDPRRARPSCRPSRAG